MASTFKAILLTSFLGSVSSQGSVYELMKSVSGFTVSDLDILFDFIDKFGRWNLGPFERFPGFYQRSRDFTHKYDHRSSEGKGFIDKIFRGAHDEHVLKVPSYITWRRLQSQFRSLDSSDCTDLVKTFPALSKLGSCGEGSTVAPQTRPNLRLSRSPEAYIGNEPFCSFYGVQSSILTYFKTAIRILKSSGLYLRKLRKRIEEHLKSTVDELDQGYLSKHKVTAVLKHTESALSLLPNEKNVKIFSEPIRMVTRSLLKASGEFLDRLEECYRVAAKEKEQVRRIAERVKNEKKESYALERRDVARYLRATEEKISNLPLRGK
ncbi:hypothetical protein RB195_011532 [Necator americanus]|uniref:Uncharacterized protein n=1 Tax=Necator americanus TaxID=51031 RepID=A0ABR1D2V6_NECAM